MRKESEQFIDSTILEGMTSIRSLLHAKENGINERSIIKILFDEAKETKLYKDLGYLKAMSSKYNYIVEKVNEETISKLSIGNTHGGLIAICGDRVVPHLTECVNEIQPNGFYAYIDGIEDPYNFGYSIRSLYACGCNGLILSERNWFSASGVVARSSAGCSEMIPCYIADIPECIQFFHNKKYTVVAADLNTNEELGLTTLKYPILLLVGGEKRGLSKASIEMADKLVKIPYNSPFHASLSAASATTMFAFEIMRQNRK